VTPCRKDDRSGWYALPGLPCLCRRCIDRSPAEFRHVDQRERWWGLCSGNLNPADTSAPSSVIDRTTTVYRIQVFTFPDGATCYRWHPNQTKHTTQEPT